MSEFRLLARNSAANVAAGASNALLAVALPPLLVRYLSPNEFSAWSVVLQLAAAVNVLQFGVQVGVGRYVAFCAARGDTAYPREIVSTALAAMAGAVVIAGALLVAMGMLLPRWFPGMPDALAADARHALWLVGGSLALGLPASVAAGAYSGLRRNDVPAAFVVLSRVGVAVAMVVLATRGHGMVALAAAYALFAGGAAIGQIALLSMQHPALAFHPGAITRRAARELAGYCVSLTVWSVAFLAISGLDAVIAGAIDFRWAGYFGVAGSAVALIVGLQTAMLQPLIAIAARWHSTGDRRRLGALLQDATQLNALVFLVAIAPLFIAGDWLADHWVGHEMATEVLPIVRVLLLGIFVRQTLAPFATLLLGTGEQRILIFTPLYEAAAKVIASIALAWWIGPLGIAVGTVVGAVVCVATNAAFTIPRVRGIVIDRGRLFGRAIGIPVLLFLPVLLLPFVEQGLDAALGLRLATAVLLAGGATLLVLSALRRVRTLVALG